MMAPHIKANLAKEVSRCFEGGLMPGCLRESTTVVLRKERKQDYSLPSSYRPIALENSITKLMEKIVTDRITAAAEAHNLLPWNQMGARKQRSTISALKLLTSCVNTAWKAQPGCIVSMLSLDLGGAFANVSRERLLHIMQRAEFPSWIIQAIQCFLTGRRTRIAFSGYESDWIPTRPGIPQGSPLFPILFLFFILELLATFEFEIKLVSPAASHRSLCFKGN